MPIYTRPLGMIRNFESQFEEDGHGGYVYRLRGKGAPIPVHRLERMRFVNQYARRVLAIQASMMIALTAFFLTFYGRTIFSSTVLPSSVIMTDPFFYAGLVLIVFPASTLIYWLGEAPARALKGREAMGPEPSKDEKRAIEFRKLSYGRILLVGLVGGASYQFIAHGHWDRRWIVVPIFAVLVSAVQAFRKWRFERTHPDLI